MPGWERTTVTKFWKLKKPTDYTVIRMSEIKRLTMPSVNEDMKQVEFFYTLLVDCKWPKHFEKTFTPMKNRHIYHVTLAIPFLVIQRHRSIYPYNMHTNVHCSFICNSQKLRNKTKQIYYMQIMDYYSGLQAMNYWYRQKHGWISK